MAVLADIATQFSLTQGASGWTYGYYPTSSGAVAFTTASVAAFDASTWGGPYTASTPRIGYPNAHPGIGTSATAAYRWTSTFDGPVTIEFTLTHSTTGGNGIIGRIWQNGAILSSTAVLLANGASQALSVSADLSLGDTVTFAVDDNGDFSADSTTISLMRISSAATGWRFGSRAIQFAGGAA